MSIAQPALTDLCKNCRDVDYALDLYYDFHRGGKFREWEKRKITLGSLEELCSSCPCCMDIAAMLSAFEIPSSSVNVFRIVIDENDIMLKYKVPRNMRPDLYNDCLYLLPSRKIADSLEHATLYEPTYFDTTVARGWISRCSTHHREMCSPPTVTLTNLKSILLIDVLDGCVVTASPDARYVALSYCWGQTKMLRALKSNISLLRQRGALSPDTTTLTIPATIADAMTFVRNIGERYLWIDALCIVQDEDDKKQIYLQNMALIYANSFFTVVAAEGPNADFGLRGVNKDMRMRDLPLRRVSFPSGALVLNKPRGGLGLDSVWNSRGWTLQESLFSTRMVIFDGFVSWVCCLDTWAEETNREELSGLPEENEDVEINSALATKLLEQETSGFTPAGRVGLLGRFPPWPDLRVWGYLVQQFNKRDLTFEKDAIDAFRGVEGAIIQSFPFGFLFGLPQFFFDVALLWQPDTKLQRRDAGTMHLPSWSWVGWRGEIETLLWDVCDDLPYHKEYPLATVSIQPLVHWAAVRSVTAITSYPITNSYHLRDSKAAVKGARDGWNSYGTEDGVNHYYTHEKIRGQHFRYPVPLFETFSSPPDPGLCYLSFECMAASFKIGGILDDRFTQREQHSSTLTFNMSILDSASRKVGFLRLNEEDVNEAPVGEKCELIAISEGTVSVAGMAQGLHTFLWKRDEWALGKWQESAEANPLVLEQANEVWEPEQNDEWEDVSADVFKFYNVLWVEWANGIAYRKALGRVIREAWDTGPWKSMSIILG